MLHYIRDLQIFAAAEVAAANASGSFTGEAEQEMLPPGAAEELINRLYRQSNGTADALQQQTST